MYRLHFKYNIDVVIFQVCCVILNFIERFNLRLVGRRLILNPS